MRVSVALPQRLGDDLVERARTVEALGFDGVWCFDHLIPLGDPRGPATEATAALGAVASATERVTVGPLVMRAGLRPVAVTAAIARTLAAVAPERAVVGLGAGDRLTRPETERFGLDFPGLAGRVERLAEAVAAVRATGVPVWVGGRHPAVVEIASGADGWNLWEVPPGEVATLAAGWTGGTLSWGGRVAPLGGRPDLALDGPETTRLALAELAAAGVAEVTLTPVPADEPERLEDLAELVIGGPPRVG